MILPPRSNVSSRKAACTAGQCACSWCSFRDSQQPHCGTAEAANKQLCVVAALPSGVSSTNALSMLQGKVRDACA